MHWPENQRRLSLDPRHMVRLYNELRIILFAAISYYLWRVDLPFGIAQVMQSGVPLSVLRR